MGHGDWPTTLDLLAKQRNHRAGRAQHIAEAHHDETGVVRLRGQVWFAVQQHRTLAGQSLQHQFGHTLGTAHHVGRPDRLVGGYQHEIAHPGTQGRLRGIQGAQRIVEHAFGDVVFDHRHMLVGRGVIHRIHFPALHDLKHPHRIADRAEGRHQLHWQPLVADTLLQLDLDGKEAELRVIEENQHRRFFVQDLPTQLGPDGASGAGHHYHLPTNAALQQFGLGCHRITAEQIGDIHGLQVLDLDPAAGQIRDIRHRAHRQRIGLEDFQNLAAPCARR
ncbi:hypothetical protein D3C78_835710 [compost metagenome]